MRGFALATILGLSACGGPTPPPATASRAEEPPPPPPAQVAVEQPLDDPVVSLRDDAVRRFTSRGTRCLIEDGEVRRARDILGADIVGARREPEGWLFVDAAGDRWRARDWLGDLTSAGTFAARPLRPTASEGVLALIDAVDGGLWLDDGSGRGERVWPVGLHDASFLDRQHGYVVVDGLLRYRTADGGSTWSPLDTGGDTPVPAHDRPGWWLWRGGRIRGHLDPDGRVDRGARPAESAVPSGHFLGPEEGRAVRDASLHRAASRTSPQVDGRWVEVSVDVDGLDLIGPDGSREPVPTSLPDHCSIHRFAGALGAVCRTERGERELYVSEDARRFERLYAGPFDDHALDPDERFATFVVESERSGPTVLGVVGPHGRVQQVELGRSARVVALRGGVVAARSETWDEDGQRVDTVWRVDLRSGRASRLALPTEPDVQLERVEVTTDGVLMATHSVHSGLDEVGARLYRMGASGETQRVPLPQGARRVAFADHLHGFATGDSLHEAFRTLDGGERWERVALVGGQPSRAPFATTETFCEADRCVLEGRELRIVIRGWGPIPEPTHRVLRGSSAPAPQTPDSREGQRPRAASVGDLACRRADLGDGPHAADGSRQGHSIAEGRLRRRGTDGWLLEWWGDDGRPFRGLSRPFELPVTPSATGLQATPLWLARAGAIVRVCDREEPGSCAVLQATAARAPGRSSVTARPGLAVAARPGAQGEALLVFEEGSPVRAELQQRVSRVGADGAIRSETPLWFTEATPLAIGVVEGRPVVAAPYTWPAYGDAPAGAQWRVLAADGSAALPSGREQTTPFAVCRGAPAPDAPVLAMSVASRDGESPGRAALRLLELGADGACLRAVELAQSVEIDASEGETFSLARLEAHDGRLRGRVRDDRAIECILEGAWLGREPEPDAFE